MTIDYDKLLEEAKKRYEKVLELDREATNIFINYEDPKEYWPVQEKFLAALDEYLDWEKNNIGKLGARLICKFRDSSPIGISMNNKVIAGHDNFFLDA